MTTYRPHCLSCTPARFNRLLPSWPSPPTSPPPLQGGENIELHLALLCILAEDLRHILDVRDIFGLIYCKCGVQE